MIQVLGITRKYCASLAKDQHSSLFFCNYSAEEKRFYSHDTRTQCGSEGPPQNELQSKMFYSLFQKKIGQIF